MFLLFAAGTSAQFCNNFTASAVTIESRCAATGKIIITAAPENIPKKLIDQLKIGGLMVMPIGNQSGTQKMQLLTKTSETQYTMEEKGEFRFVPMLNSKEIKSRHHF